MKRVLLTRTVTALFAVFVVVSVTFAGLALSPDPNLQGQLWDMQRHGATDQELAEFRDQYLDRNRLSRGDLGERYVAWLWAFATFDLGTSGEYGEPVTTVLAERVPVTLSYFVPGLGIAVLANTVAGLFAGRRRNSRQDRLVRIAVYAALGIPAFYVALMVNFQFGMEWHTLFRVTPATYDPLGDALERHLLAIGLIAMASSAAVFQHVRAAASEYYATDVIRLLRASGAGPLTIIRHAVRNLAASLASLVFAEAVGVLLVTVYVVETVLRIPGVGTATLEAIRARDVPLVVGVVFFFAAVIATGNLLLDVTRAVLDPRTGSGD